MRTDVGTFTVRIPPSPDVAKVTIEFSNSERMVFHLFHHLPDGQAAVQLSGILLEIEAEASEKLLEKVWQAKKEGIAKIWERDERCMGCSQARQRFSPACNSCDEAIRKDRLSLAIGEPLRDE